MKRWPLSFVISALCCGAIFSLVISPALQAQPQLTEAQILALTPLDPNTPAPFCATYWVFDPTLRGGPFGAPLPCNAYGNAIPVYPLGDDQYLLMASDIATFTLQQQQTDAALRLLEGQYGLSSPMEYGLDEGQDDGGTNGPMEGYSYPSNSL